MNRISRARLTPWHRAVLGLSVAALLFFSTACVDRKPCRYLIPHRYVGWVLIELDVDGGTPPREEDGYRVFEIPPSGQLAIPGEPEYGWARDEYYYVDEQGTLEELPVTAPGDGGLIWGGATGSYEEEGALMLIYEYFFVGPEEEFKRAPTIDDLIRSRAAGESARPAR